jgi:exopolysaccharide biosynthesis predicted pyruvyltransferase EpsI
MKTRQPVSTSDVLAPYRDRPVYLHEVSGNNGDELILRGSQFLLKRHGCVPVSTPEEAEVLLINGGFKSDFWPFANETIREFSINHPDKPLVILPSSYLFSETDFPALFAGRHAPVTIMAREHPSLDLIRAMDFPCEVRFGLDHDTAFALAEDPEFVLMAKSPTYRDLLIVERGDAESVSGMSETGLLNSSTLRSIAAHALPRPALSLAARLVGKARRANADQATSPFAQEAVALATTFLDRQPETLLATDVSRRSVCTFPEFCSEIARSEVIVSTRLHVAILGAILGRRTYIVAGKYHKIPGIYEYSMAAMDHVSMVSPHCELVA